MKRKLRILISAAVLILWAMFIFGMSGESGEHSAGMSKVLADFVYGLPFVKNIFKFDMLHFLIRKTAHFTEYGILNLLVLNLLYSIKKFDGFFRIYVISTILCLVYASLDEYHQTLVPGRDGNIRDVIIDTCGSAFFGMIFDRIIFGRKQKEDGEGQRNNTGV